MVENVPSTWIRAHDFLAMSIWYWVSATICGVLQTQGTLTLILKGEVSVRLTSSSLLVRNQLFQDKFRFFFIFKTT